MAPTTHHHLFEGAITAAAFASGDAVVVGTWARSPLGTFIDVMWRTDAGRRILLAPTTDVATYVDGLYAFDEVRVGPISGGVRGDFLDVVAGPLHLTAVLAGRQWQSLLFALRPRVLRRAPSWIRIEDQLARPVIGRLLGGGAGVRAAGVAPGGQTEFYGADDWRRLRDAQLLVAGEDAGALSPMPADFGVGLSAFPTIPASVRVGTIVQP
ncbi:hypothetical protein [Euzebya tangerina]|uniref:hypothetical protein n=1 Tax=Euzebya tangerina TaxID=591198 RepID=UPI000E30F970|nr:hypothetical protein [Euzebya tangerina]